MENKKIDSKDEKDENFEWKPESDEHTVKKPTKTGRRNGMPKKPAQPKEDLKPGEVPARLWKHKDREPFDRSYLNQFPQTTGRGGNSNFPSAGNNKFNPENNEQRAIVQQMMRETLIAYSQKRVESDEELIKRLSDYFAYCAETGQYPTWEEACLTTGYTIETCGDWERGDRYGFSKDTAKIIKRAKQFLRSLDAKMAVAGKVNPVVYFFRAKNYYGMRDQQDVVVAPRKEEEYSIEEIRKQYQGQTYDKMLENESGKKEPDDESFSDFVKKDSDF